MTFAVLGAGNTGQAITSYLSMKGEQVKLYCRDKQKAEKLSLQGLKLQGIYQGEVTIDASDNLEYVVGNKTKYIIITTTAFGHESILKKLKPLLRDKQTIALFPGYWGAVEAINILGDLIPTKNITIAETSAMPFVSKADNEGSVFINKIKSNVLISAISTSKISQTFLKAFPQLKPTKSIFETSLNNTNVVVHTPITLFNASRIDAPEAFQFYGQGVSPRTVSYIEKLDAERIAIASVLNIPTKDILTLLNEFYGTAYPGLYEALPGLFPEGLAPNTLDHRYVTEDIPYGLVPISELGKKVGLHTPYTDSLIDTASLLMERNFREEGVSFEAWDRGDILTYGSLAEQV